MKSCAILVLVNVFYSNNIHFNTIILFAPRNQGQAVTHND